MTETNYREFVRGYCFKCKQEYTDQEHPLECRGISKDTWEEEFDALIGPSSKAVDYFYSPKIRDFIRKAITTAVTAAEERARREEREEILRELEGLPLHCYPDEQVFNLIRSRALLSEDKTV